MTRHVSIALLILLCVSSILIVFVARMALGPADLYEKDQPKTLAYTADILLNGRFALPRDVIYQPATKPPFYNWLAAGVIRVTGSWSELAMKSPSVLGAIGVAGVLAIVSIRAGPSSNRYAKHDAQRTGPGMGRLSGAVALLACAIWFSFGVDVRHGSVIRLMFLARPDMLQAFFLTGAWAAATCALRARMRFAFAFWLCITCAILTKGPLALLAIVYAILAARIVGGSWRTIRALRPVTGTLGTLLVVGTWLACAYRADPDHVRQVLFGAEMVERFSRQTPEGIANPFWYSAMWFVSKGGIFSVLALLTLPVIAIHQRMLRPPDAAALGAALWLVVLLVGLSLPAGKRIDYLLPTFAPAAYLAARLLVSVCRRASIPVALAGLLPLWMAITLARANLTTFHEAQEHWSDRAITFAQQVRSRVDDAEPLLVIVRGKHPLITLLHRHQGSALDVEQLAAARWIVLALVDTNARPVIQSELLPVGFETIDTRTQAVLGLFDMRSADRPTVEELVAAQKRVATWTAEENPYHEAQTVWRELPRSIQRSDNDEGP